MRTVRLALHLLPASVSFSLAAPLPLPPPSSDLRPRVIKVTYVNVKAGEDGSSDVVTVLEPPDGAQSPRDFIEEQVKVAVAVAAGPPTVVIETGTPVAGKSEEVDSGGPKKEEEEKAEEVAVVAAEAKLEAEAGEEEPKVEVEIEAPVAEHDTVNASDKPEGEEENAEPVETEKPSEEDLPGENRPAVVSEENTPELGVSASPEVSEADKADGPEVADSKEKGESTEEETKPESETEPAQPSYGTHFLLLSWRLSPQELISMETGWLTITSMVVWFDVATAPLLRRLLTLQCLLMRSCCMPFVFFFLFMGVSLPVPFPCRCRRYFGDE